MKPMLTYFFRSAQAAAFFIVLHVFTTIAIIWCMREFDVCDPWNYFYLELMAFTLIMYWVLSNKHRQKLIALADPVKYRYPDIEYGGPEGITPTWPGGVPIHDLLTWISASRQLSRPKILKDWYTVPGLKERNEKQHAEYLARF